MGGLYEDLDDETFVPLVEVDDCFKGRYEINKKGQVRIIGKSRILAVMTKSTDYPKVMLRDLSDTRGRGRFVHVLLARTFIRNDDPTTKTQVNHKDRNRFNYSLDNLEWVSPSENLKQRGEMKSWNRLYYVKLDDQGNEIERFSRKDISKNTKDSITESIRESKKYKGFWWKSVDINVEKYYSRFTPEQIKSEKWKEAFGYPGVYVSSLGLVKLNGRITVGHLIDSGYRTVNLKPHKRVHTLIAETFILKRALVKPEVVDHLNTDRELNAVWNLKVCKNQSENLANPITRNKNNFIKRVGKYDFSGNLIAEYDCINDALKEMKLPPTVSSISKCCKENRLHFKDHLWAYLDGTENEVIERKLKLLNDG